MADYAELHCHSYYSLLDGVSSPEALVQTAKALNLRALALTDHNNLSGAVRFWRAAKAIDLHPIIGAEVTLDDGSHLTLLAETQEGYANLCRLLTASRLNQVDESATEEPDLWLGKVEPLITTDLLHQYSKGLIALSGCRRGALPAALLQHDTETATTALQELLELFGPSNLYLELQHHQLPKENQLIRGLTALGKQFGVPLVATNNVHYATADLSRLQDCVVAIKQNQTLKAAYAQNSLYLNDTYHLASGQTMAHRFHELPQALQTTLVIAERCHVSLDFSDRRLPPFATPNGETELEYIYKLCHENLKRCYPTLHAQVLKQLGHELAVADKAGLLGFFLIVWDIIRFAGEQGILIQPRGSGAGSILVHLLGITAIDPLQFNLLFERFLSEDRHTMPDIDLDIQADRREEVIQYVYDKYGEHHTAMVCNTVTFQARSALRDLAKMLDFPTPVIDRLANAIDTHSAQTAADQLLAQVGDDQTEEHPLKQLATLMRQIEGLPRHLSIHSGGMIITGPPLDEIVPLEPATMPGRVIVQWDKDSVEDAGLIKFDLLGLRMLGLIAEATEAIQTTEQVALDLNQIPLNDPEIYKMLQQADTIGTFQVESRAQLQMLPRLKPETFEDIATQIAIIRPGPIQGGAVHPYLKRRRNEEPVAYLHPCLKPVLKETLGVLLYQEQAIRVAMVAANFTPGEADLLRRALTRSRPETEMVLMQERFLRGARENKIDEETATKIFDQLAGFAGYGFCKSHAASFAHIAYKSLYLKRYYPAHFYVALLNHQPMGFYSTEVIINDAKRHGVELLPPNINRSDWNYMLERNAKQKLVVRTGFKAIKGIGTKAWEQISSARRSSPFPSLSDFCHRTHLSKELVTNLIRSGAMDEFGDRRQLLWQLGTIDIQHNALKLPTVASEIELADLPELQQTLWEYELMGLSPDTQIMKYWRGSLRKAGVLSTWEVKQRKAGTRVMTAGMVVVRQRPQTAKGIMFVSIEDESGLLDLVVRPNVYERIRSVLRSQILIVVMGLVEREGQAVNVLVGDAITLVS